MRRWLSLPRSRHAWLFVVAALCFGIAALAKPREDAAAAGIYRFYHASQPFVARVVAIRPQLIYPDKVGGYDVDLAGVLPDGRKVTFSALFPGAGRRHDVPPAPAPTLGMPVAARYTPGNTPSVTRDNPMAVVDSWRNWLGVRYIFTMLGVLALVHSLYFRWRAARPVPS